jgi:hypothetical protein
LGALRRCVRFLGLMKWVARGRMTRMQRKIVVIQTIVDANVRACCNGYHARSLREPHNGSLQLAAVMVL